MTSSNDRSSRRHVMVTGCAGFIGKAVCRDIISKGESIVGLYHHKLPEALDRMMPLCADLNTSEGLLAPLRSVDTVIHLAWTGGVLGSEIHRGSNPNQEKLSLSGNVAMTANLVKAMEKQGVRRIIFMSWLGADDRNDRLVLREKYWAENIILNSKIPEKIILRSGVIVDPEDKGSEFAAATQRLMKMPMFTPLPKVATDMVFTSRKDLVAKISKLAITTKPYEGMIIDQVTTTAPVSSSEALLKFSQKWWGQKKISLGGFIGRQLFALVDSQFGRLPAGSPKIADFLSLSRSIDSLSGDTLGTALLP